MVMNDIFACYHLPQEALDAHHSLQTLTFSLPKERAADQKTPSKVQLQVPVLTTAELEKVVQRIKQARSSYLVRLSTGELVELIDEAVWKWLDSRYEWRQVAEEFLPVVTGYDREMIRLFLGRYLRRFRRESLLRIIDEDFPNPYVLDEFRPRRAGGMYRAYGPQLITHIFSGNVPVLPVWSIVAGLLLKSATIGKVSSSEPLFPVLFARTIAEIEPRVAETMAMLWWKGGDDELERAAFRQSEAVIAYGGQKTTQAIARKVPSGVRFVEHGHKVSFGVVTNEALQLTKVWDIARRAAEDVSWFDQQGCLSPHVFFVEEGGQISVKDFARILAQEMDRFERKMPRAVLSTAENQAIITKRSEAEFQSLHWGDTQISSGDELDAGAEDHHPNDAETELHHSEQGTAWTVIYQANPSAFPFSVLNRMVTVVPIKCMEELTDRLKDVQHLLQTAGVACSPQKFHALIDILGRAGVNRISYLGEMSQPEPGWHHDGRFHLGELVRWCDVESTVERKMDELDPWRE